jgi:hypothetical protein
MAGAITLVDVASDAIQIAWLPGSDNVGVAAYEVSKDGGSSYVSVGNVLGYLFTGLPSSTVHQLRVRAKDAAGNTSAALALAQATLAPPAPPASVPRIGVAANGELVALLGSSSRGLCVGITAAGKLLVMPSAPTTFPRVGSLANGQLMAIL